MIGTSKDTEQVKHLQELSEKILQSEVPLAELNTQMDEDWWAYTHPEEE